MLEASAAGSKKSSAPNLKKKSNKKQKHQLCYINQVPGMRLKNRRVSLN